MISVSTSVSNNAVWRSLSKQARRASSVSFHDTDVKHEGEKGHMALILGKPGGGKGTISGKILNDFPIFRHLATGDLLREHVRNRSELGIQAKDCMDAGRLVPDELMIQLVVDDASSDITAGNSMLLDGFPRTIQQAMALDDAIDVDIVINLDIPTETIIERLSDRWIHQQSGRIYSYSYRPPKVEGKDDLTGDQLVQREDDKPDTIRKRLELYDEATSPLVEFYEDKGVLQTFQGTKSDVIYVNVESWLSSQVQTRGSM